MQRHRIPSSLPLHCRYSCIGCADCLQTPNSTANASRARHSNQLSVDEAHRRNVGTRTDSESATYRPGGGSVANRFIEPPSSISQSERGWSPPGHPSWYGGMRDPPEPIYVSQHADYSVPGSRYEPPYPPMPAPPPGSSPVVIAPPFPDGRRSSSRVPHPSMRGPSGYATSSASQPPVVIIQPGDESPSRYESRSEQRQYTHRPPSQEPPITVTPPPSSRPPVVIVQPGDESPLRYEPRRSERHQHTHRPTSREPPITVIPPPSQPPVVIVQPDDESPSRYESRRSAQRQYAQRPPSREHPITVIPPTPEYVSNPESRSPVRPPFVPVPQPSERPPAVTISPGFQSMPPPMPSYVHISAPAMDHPPRREQRAPTPQVSLVRPTSPSASMTTWQPAPESQPSGERQQRSKRREDSGARTRGLQRQPGKRRQESGQGQGDSIRSN